MPIYELSLVMRVLPRNELAAGLKRVGCLLIDKGAKVTKLENLGLDKDLPSRIRLRGASHFKGNFFVYHFMSSPKIFPDIEEECSRDVDILKYNLGDTYRDLVTPCTLEEELLPPAQRPSVLDLLEKGQKHKQKTKPFYWHVKEWNWFHKDM